MVSACCRLRAADRRAFPIARASGGEIVVSPAHAFIPVLSSAAGHVFDFHRRVIRVFGGNRMRVMDTRLQRASPSGTVAPKL